MGSSGTLFVLRAGLATVITAAHSRPGVSCNAKTTIGFKIFLFSGAGTPQIKTDNSRKQTHPSLFQDQPAEAKAVQNTRG